jgi:cytochrome b
MTPTQTKVFDVPTRLFHWTLAGLFVVAFSIGKFVDDEAAIFPYHSMLGLLMVGAVLMRLVWGVAGTRYARFGSFKLNPLDLAGYLKSVATGRKTPTLGRNPASSFAALAMVGLTLGLGATGYLMATATSEAQAHDIKEIHEVLAILFAVIAALHIVGIIVHTISQKDPIGRSMLDGNKPGVIGETGITATRPLVGMLFLAALAGGAVALNAGYNPASRTLVLAGQTLHLGENEIGEGGEVEGGKGEQDAGPASAKDKGQHTEAGEAGEGDEDE